MRIALVIGNYDAYGGGAERWTDQHARMLLERGHDVHLVARHFRGAPDGAITHVIEAGNRKYRRRIRFARQAEALLRTLNVDIVHDMGDGWYADVIQPHHGTRRGNFHHGNQNRSATLQAVRWFFSKWVPRYLEFEAVERRQYENASTSICVAVSNMIREHLQRYYRVPDDRLRVIYNGVDTERFQPDESNTERKRVREALGLEDRTLFLIVAHNFKLKGVDTAMRACAELNRRDDSVGLVVVGNGPIGRYGTFARALGCAHAIRFVGDQPDSRPYYQAADVFVLPTQYDPCSLVVLEAMASGLPVITTMMNGVHELMQNGREGLIMNDYYDHLELAECIRTYMDESVRKRTAQSARNLAERQSSQRVFERYINIYEQVLESRPRAHETKMTNTPFVQPDVLTSTK